MPLYGAFDDGVADFDAALRDPKIPTQMRAEDDCGDGLHPSDSGYCNCSTRSERRANLPAALLTAPPPADAGQTRQLPRCSQLPTVVGSSSVNGYLALKAAVDTGYVQQSCPWRSWIHS